MGRLFGCISLVIKFTGATCIFGAPTLEKQLFVKGPSIHAVGIQFDLKRAFVTDLTPDGLRQFLATQDGGLSWINLIIRTGRTDVGTIEDYMLSYYNEGSGAFFYRGNFYCAESETAFHKCLIKSVILRGQDGFRIENELSKATARRILRTKDGGQNWFEIRNSEVSFDSIESFDPVSTNLVFACVYLEDSSRDSKRRLLMSSDSGRNWTSVCNPETDVGIWATHVFFLDDANGWISSDRDDGLYATTDAGKTWTEVSVPERVVSAIFFKNARQGRVIGGVNPNVYETTDAGKNWTMLSKDETTSAKFLDYFAPHPLSRWNDFAVLRTILSSPGRKPQPSGRP